MLPRYLTIIILSLMLCPPSGVAASNAPDDSGAIHQGGLVCFSINPPDAPTNGPAGPRFPPQPPPTYRSCDELCAARHAACTATTSDMNPMRSCASTYYDPGPNTLCRCCTVAR